MPIFDVSGNLRVAGDRAGNIEIRDPAGNIVASNATFLQFSGSAVNSVATSGLGVLINLLSGSGTSSDGVTSSFWVDGTTQPRIRTTASVAISSQNEFAEDLGANIHFYVSGTIVTGSDSSGKVSLFGGSIITSGNLHILDSVSSQSFIEFKHVDADPAIPASGRTRLYSSTKAGRSFMETMGPSGLDYLLQPGIFNNFVAYAGPNTTTTLLTWGTNFTTSGTVAHNAPVIAAVSGIMGTSVNTRFTPAAAIGNGAGVRTTNNVCWRGSWPGAGGWFVFIRFAVFINAPTRCFVGLNSTNAFLGHTTDISASTNFIGMGWDRNDPLTGTWRIMRRDASTYVTEEIPNMLRPGTTGSLIDFICFAPPSGTFINVEIREHVSTSVGVLNLQRWTQTYTSSLPTNQSLMRVQAGIFNQTGSGTGNMFLNRMYIETDY